MSEPSIRPATIADCEVLASLLTELNIGEGYEVTTQADDLEASLFGEGREVALKALVAEQGGEVIGGLLYYPGYDTLSASVGYHLADVVVTWKYRRTGIGRKLMQALAAHAIEEKKEWVSLTVLKKNGAAREFYTALAMAQVDVDFFALGARGLMGMCGR